MKKTRYLKVHDAVLKDMRMNWFDGWIEWDIEGWRFNLKLVCMGLATLDLSRTFEWGPSKSINEASIQSQEGGSKLLTIEIQSGDIITCKCIEIREDRYEIIPPE